MKHAIQARPWLAVVLAFLAGALVVTVAWVAVATVDRVRGTDPGPAEAGPSGSPRESAAPPEASGSPAPPANAGEECPALTVEVGTADELEDALTAARPGDVIGIRSGEYVGNFVARASGTPEQPIHLCGTADAVLDGDDDGDGYVFHLDHAQYWVLDGFSVTNGQKGVMADGTVGSVIRGLTVFAIGDEAIHLRNFSTDNVVRGNTVSDTGRSKKKSGEGIYIGSAESNWCDITDCDPDLSDRNVVEDNRISGTTAESVDIKEGTTGGIVRGNTFDGSDISAADSWVDVKGNGWLIEGNTGTNSPGDGFQTHEILDGWGTDNVFRDNTATVNGPGFGYALTPVLDNVVECSNRATGGDEGLANVECVRA
ncbi:hypothetical protein ACFDTO_06990 [Microbacteriaceae bacterium 4G12]